MFGATATIKKTKGRQKIEIKKIDKKSSLRVAFTKRRSGIFKKASELAILCGARLAILVQSPAGKLYSFAHPSDDAVLHAAAAPPSPSAAASAYEEAAARLEVEKRRGGKEWWNDGCEGLELHQLEEYLESLMVLKGNVDKKLTKGTSVVRQDQRGISAAASLGCTSSDIDFDDDLAALLGCTWSDVGSAAVDYDDLFYFINF